MPAVFITGTDTGVGKTIVTAGLAGFLAGQGKRVCVWKPIQTGATDHEQPDDPTLIAELCGKTVDTRWSYCFPIPAAPYVSDRLENPDQLTIQPTRLVLDYKRLLKAYDWVLVEGAGGIRVPLGAQFDTLDLIRLLHCPVMVVARPNLGTINHTLLTVDALRHADIPVSGVVVSNMPNLSDTSQPVRPASQTNLLTRPGDAKSLSDWPDREAVSALPWVFDEVLPVPLLGYVPPLVLESGSLAPGSSQLSVFAPIASGLCQSAGNPAI